MKTANVVEVRDLGPLNRETHSPEAEDRVEQMATLLRLYPTISATQKAALIHFLKKGQQVEIGLASAREGIAGQIARFRQDHPEEFRLKPREIAGFFALILIPLATLIWLCMP